MFNRLLREVFGNSGTFLTSATLYGTSGTFLTMAVNFNSLYF